jgi:hypothetical protein
MGKKSKGSNGGANAKGAAKGASGKDKASRKKENKNKDIAGEAAQEEPLDTKQSLSLDTDETMFLRQVSITLPAEQSIFGLKQRAQVDAVNLQRALQTLDTYHMCILHNALSEEELAIFQAEYRDLLDVTGDAAIGEKDASRRSGTRFYNCRCQVGPNCQWDGWKPGAERSRGVLALDGECCYNAKKPPSVWRQVIAALEFEHVARVEVVTSHVGCRSQNWHVDGVHGMTVIFALEDVDLAKGPTQLDFTHPFNSFKEGESKVKNVAKGALPVCRAAMPAGSVLMFNCNVSHRGTANISSVDRPILVLDCKLQSACVDSTA